MSTSHTYFERELAALGKRLSQYFEESCRGEGRAIYQQPMAKIAEDLRLEHWIEAGQLQEGELDKFFESYLANTTRLHHPGYMAHQVATPEIRTSLGHLVDGFTNNPMNIYEMGPAASTIEYTIINWMLKEVGWEPRPWPDTLSMDTACGGGMLTHGGSLANLTAMLAARARAFPNAWTQGYQQRLVILAPGNNHYSIERAAGIMGLGTSALRLVPTDKDGRLKPDHIEAVYRKAVEAGEAPIALVSNACGTAAGLYDPLREVGEVCQSLGLWHHIDGAHGAGALVSSKHRHLMDGVELADSLTWDAHKLLATPSLCAAILVRDHRTLERNFQQEASYLFHDKDEPGFDFIARTIECTKSGMGLRLFLSLASMGREGLADHVDRLFELAQIAYEEVGQRSNFSSPVAPDCNILCFRYGDDDDLQLRLRKHLVREGRYYITSTLYQGRRYLRLALMNPRATRNDLVGMLQQIETLAETIN